jgi:hypothetical protein
MDKQEAIAFILQEYEQGASQADITARLSVRLNAPAELTGKFVAQAIAQHTHAATRPVSEVLAQPRETLAPQRIEAPLTPPHDPAGGLSQPPATPDPVVSWSPPQASAPSREAPAKPASPQADAELEAFILKALSKTSKQSDVVMAVCERAGLSWNEAQRIVARVATHNHKKLAGRQNRIILPLAVIAVLIGLLLAYAGLSEIIMLGSAVLALQSGNPAAVPVEAGDPMSNAPWALFIGLGLALGGGVGLFKALKAQMDA